MEPNKVKFKQVLSLLRNGDYAHPGEEQAIDMAFANIPKNLQQKILDLG